MFSIACTCACAYVHLCLYVQVSSTLAPSTVNEGWKRTQFTLQLDRTDRGGELGREGGGEGRTERFGHLDRQFLGGGRRGPALVVHALDGAYRKEHESEGKNVGTRVISRVQV